MASASNTPFLQELERLTTYWDLALLLAESSDGVEREGPLWHAVNSAAEEIFDVAVDAALGRESDDLVTEAQKQHVAEQTDGGIDRVAANAIAWAVDATRWHFFAHGWRVWLGDPDGRVSVAAGDPFPVADLDRASYPHLAVLRTRGTSKRRVERGELPHLRRFDGGTLGDTRVSFDFSFEADLRGVLVPLDEIILVQLNEGLAEICQPGTTEIFPVGPTDPAAQKRLVDQALARIDPEANSVVVLPELSMNSDLVDAVEQHIGSALEFAPLVVVAGSRHVLERGVPRNLSEALIPNAGRRLEHRKLVRFEHLSTRDGKLVEGIEQSEELVVFPAGAARFAILICKDALEPRLARLTAELGVTVLAIPAMSGTTDDFRERIGGFVVDSQGFAAMTNGPLRWESGPVLPRVLVGQPLQDETVLDSTDEGPPRAVFRYRPGDGFAAPEELRV